MLTLARHESHLDLVIASCLGPPTLNMLQLSWSMVTARSSNTHHHVITTLVIGDSQVSWSLSHTVSSPAPPLSAASLASVSGALQKAGASEREW